MEEVEAAQYCYQDRNSTCRKYSISTSIYITLYIFFSLISAVTVFLNLLVIISISHFKQLHTPTNLLILSLSVSDLLVGLIVIPAMTVAIMEPCWVLGEYFCALLLFITYLCSLSSLCNLILMSVDRYVAVCYPLMYHSKITVTRITCCISISWCYCIISDAVGIRLSVNVHVPSKCFNECYLIKGNVGDFTIDLIHSWVIPCAVVVALYLKIFLVARSQARNIFPKSAVSSSSSGVIQANKSERKATKTLGIVVFSYLLFWNPFTFLLFILASTNLATSIISFLPLVNSFVNPIIYAFYYPWFKVTAKQVIRGSKKAFCPLL